MRAALRTILFGPPPIAYLLRDEFGTDAAAPLASPRTCAPGPGTLTITDPNSVISISGSRLVVNGTGASANGIISTASYARVAGRAFLWSMPTRTTVTGRPEAGWTDTNSLSQDVDYGVRVISTTAVGYKIGGANDLNVSETLGSGVWDFVAVMRGTGALLLGRNGGSGDYSLLWVYAAGATALYPKMWPSNAGAQNLTFDSFRVVDLPSPWNDDYGIVTQRLAGARSAADAFAHAANGLVEWTQTTLGSGGRTKVFFRQQDASNYWSLEIVGGSGNAELNEVVAGTPTLRGTAAGSVATGNRCVLVFDGTTIRFYSNDTLRFTYASASNFQTQTSGVLSAIGTSAAVSDIIAWPRTPSFPSGY